MTTQYKWLPNEPTPAMIEKFSHKYWEHVGHDVSKHKEYFLEAFEAMWQAAPAVEQEPVGEIYEQQTDGSCRARWLLIYQ
jgi:hypothetical protein